MALYNVRVTTLDGLSEIVPVHADNISEARRKAESQSEYGSRATGVPTLVAPPPGFNLAQAQAAAETRIADPREQQPTFSTPGSDSFTAMVASVDPNYDPTGGAYSTTNLPVEPYDPTGGAYSTYRPPTIREYDPLGGAGFDSNRLNGGASPIGYDPTGGAYSGMYGETFVPPPTGRVPGFNPPAADLSNQLAYADYADSQGMYGGGAGYEDIGPVYDPLGGAGFAPVLPYSGQGGSNTFTGSYDPMGGGEGEFDIIDAAAAAKEKDRLARRAEEEKARKADEIEAQKQASLLTGPVRSWDAKLGDITINPDGTVNLPTDMWRNASPKTLGRGGEQSVADQPIGREQIEDAIRRIAELGGRDDLNRSVSNMLQQARNYYSSTPRGDNTWDKHIDSGLIDGKLLADAGFKATWAGFADEVLGAKEAVIETQIPKDPTVPSAWQNNPDGFNSYSDAQKADIIANNLKSHKEVQDFYSSQSVTGDGVSVTGDGVADAAAGADDLAKQLESGFDAQALYDVGKDVVKKELPEFTTKGFDFGQFDGPTSMEELEAAAGVGGGVLGPGEGGIYDQTLPVIPPPAAAGSFPVYSSQELINDPQGYLTAAGQRLAFRNVFGDAATGVGPLSSYLQRQTFPLTNAYRGASWANMAREGAGGPPQPSFEDFLRTIQQQPTGLSGTFGQTLQDVNYLRGLGGSQIPVGLEGVFNPEQAAGTRDARSLLQAAQRGKYSRLVSSAFRRPTEEDLFSDYVLARQDASTAGTAPQNFLNFAASRYGL